MRAPKKIWVREVYRDEMRILNRTGCERRHSFTALMLVTLLLLVGISGCEVSQIAIGSMPSVAPLSVELTRGTSSRADVARFLGQPSGTGGSRLPPDWQARDIWFYQSLKVNGIHREIPGTGGALTEDLRADVTQNILLVFFADDLYDGYMWYSNAGLVEGKAHQSPLNP